MDLNEALETVHEIDFASEVFEGILSDEDVKAIETVIDAADNKRMLNITHDISCSKCGKQKKISLNSDSKNSITKVAHSWTTTGYVLYCPNCTKLIKNYTNDYETVISAMLNWITM